METLAELPAARTYLFDTAPKGLLRIAGDRLPAGYRRQLARYRYNPGVFKIDWALDGPIPWRAAECTQSATVHLGGTLAEITASEEAVWRGHHPERPYVLLAQQSLFDPSRAPAGKHVAWAYCHVPNGSIEDMTTRIERQVERFAPGFGDRILARSTRNAPDMERYNPNYVGGDINAGVQDLLQQYTRPTLSLTPYRTSAAGLYLCSSATPPGGGVHGLCGYFAARTVLKDLGISPLRRIRQSPADKLLLDSLLENEIIRYVNALEAVGEVAHAGAACDIAGQPFHLHVVRVARGVHLVVEAQIGGGFVFQGDRGLPVSPEHGDRLADDAHAVFVEDVRVNVVLAARLLFIFPTCLD